MTETPTVISGSELTWVKSKVTYGRAMREEKPGTTALRAAFVQLSWTIRSPASSHHAVPTPEVPHKETERSQTGVDRIA